MLCIALFCVPTTVVAEAKYILDETMLNQKSFLFKKQQSNALVYT